MGLDAAIPQISGSAELDDLIRSEDRGAVVEFWGTWCRPCRALRPNLERIAHNHADTWRFAAVHVDKNPEPGGGVVGAEYPYPDLSEQR